MAATTGLVALFVAAGGGSDIIVGANKVSLPLPGGIVPKFGTVSGSYVEQSVSHTFDTPFANKCWAVLAIPINSTGGATRDILRNAKRFSKTGFTIVLQWSGGSTTSPSSDGFDFISIGN